jgi:hypothetical protein
MDNLSGKDDSPGTGQVDANTINRIFLNSGNGSIKQIE